MASRTKLLGIQEYDSDGGLDFFIKGTQWTEWYKWRVNVLVSQGWELSEAKNLVRLEVLTKFEQCVEQAIRIAE